MAVNTTQIGVLALLFAAFLAVPSLAKSLGRTIDSLPMRFAAVILILAVLPYDRLVALGLFLVIAGLYIQRHHDEVLSVSGTSVNNKAIPVDAIQSPAAMKALHHGGHAAQSYDTDDFMPKNDEDNTFEPLGYNSIDEKHVLPTEQLGSRAQAMFGEEMRNAEALQRGNSDRSI